jgi:hypothetical protein
MRSRSARAAPARASSSAASAAAARASAAPARAAASAAAAAASDSRAARWSSRPASSQPPASSWLSMPTSARAPRVRARHIGHAAGFFARSHSATQGPWNTWPHSSAAHSASLPPKQMQHDTTPRYDAMAAAGGWFPLSWIYLAGRPGWWPGWRGAGAAAPCAAAGGRRRDSAAAAGLRPFGRRRRRGAAAGACGRALHRGASCRVRLPAAPVQAGPAGPPAPLVCARCSGAHARRARRAGAAAAQSRTDAKHGAQSVAYYVFSAGDAGLRGCGGRTVAASVQTTRPLGVGWMKEWVLLRPTASRGGGPAAARDRRRAARTRCTRWARSAPVLWPPRAAPARGSPAPLATAQERSA